jgi:RNA polymerase sigma factor (sigma-70 family)
MLPDRQLLECELLVVRCQRGDRSAFELIVAMWERSLFYYLRRLAPSEEDAWDWLQETWLKTFRSLPALRDPRTLPAFLYSTARNTAISRLRTGEFHRPAAEPLEESLEASGDDAALFDDAEAVHHALDRLPLPHREALTLYFLEDLSLDEMASLLGIPLGTVKSRLHYAKLAIHKLLTEGGCHVR